MTALLLIAAILPSILVIAVILMALYLMDAAKERRIEQLREGRE